MSVLDIPLRSTVLGRHHAALGGKMVGFGGYAMPVQYPLGILKEHLWTRAHAAVFDVSHMGPAFLDMAWPSGDGEADHRAVAALIEPLVCGDIAGLKPGQLRYTLLLNSAGGIIDDLIIGRPPEPGLQGRLYLVVNAGSKEADFEAIAGAVGNRGNLTRADRGGLIAVQGPEAVDVVEAIFPGAAALGFMTFASFRHEGEAFIVARSGYTGEDGFEILSPPKLAGALWDRLLQDERARPAGLGARDSLRLEAGLPLYGHDADESVSPIEANLAFAISKRRLRAGVVPGAARIARELAEGPGRLRIGLRVLEGAPAREGAVITDAGGAIIGRVTSGGFSPSLAAPIAMGFLSPKFAAPETRVSVIVREKPQAAEVVPLPFVPHRYVRKPAA